MKTLLSIVAPCYNEKDNIPLLYERVLAAIVGLERYDFEFVFIDNASQDGTIEVLRALAARDTRVKVILNTRNFGHVRSPYWGLLQSRGAASIYLASDLQDPPEYIPQFIEGWEMGWKVVLAVKPYSKTHRVMHLLRKSYYRFLDRISSVQLIKDSTGFGLYDKVVLDHVRKIDDPYPYFRGLVCEIGYPIKTVPFTQGRRERGVTKNNFYSLYDFAMLGIVNHSLVPLRIASMVGMLIGTASFLVALFYGTMKLLYWNTFPMGIAPLIIGIFMLFGLLFFFIGLLGEYVGSIHQYVRHRPIVVERERINF